jgi:hypothetical protein
MVPLTTPRPPSLSSLPPGAFSSSVSDRQYGAIVDGAAHNSQATHAVVAVRQENRWLILDNRTMAILDAEDVRDYRPLFALDQHGTRAIATAGIERVTNR